MRLVLGRNEQTFVQKRSGNAFEPSMGRGKVRRTTEEAAPCDGSSWIEETERSQGENKTAPTRSETFPEGYSRRFCENGFIAIALDSAGWPACAGDMDRVDRPSS
jgi:hypothetical protein